MLAEAEPEGKLVSDPTQPQDTGLWIATFGLAPADVDDNINDMEEIHVVYPTREMGRMAIEQDMVDGWEYRDLDDPRLDQEHDPGTHVSIWWAREQPQRCWVLEPLHTITPYGARGKT